MVTFLKEGITQLKFSLEAILDPLFTATSGHQVLALCNCG